MLQRGSGIAHAGMIAERVPDMWDSEVVSSAGVVGAPGPQRHGAVYGIPPPRGISAAAL